MRIFLTTKTWREGKHYIAYTPEMDIATQGKTQGEAEKRLHEAVALFIEETKRMGTFIEVMRQAGFLKHHQRWEVPSISISALEVSV